MQLKAMKVFCDVVRQRSFSRAADENHISQSAASQLVQHLEEELHNCTICFNEALNRSNNYKAKLSRSQQKLKALEVKVKELEGNTEKKPSPDETHQPKGPSGRQGTPGNGMFG